MDRAYYSSVEGTIENIYTKRSTFNGEEVIRWYIDIRDGRELYTLCLPYTSGVFKSIILSLAGAENLTASTPIRIYPYLGKNGYTKVAVYADGKKLDWVTKELPQQQIIKVGDKELKDNKAQMNFIISLCNKVREKLSRV